MWINKTVEGMKIAMINCAFLLGNLTNKFLFSKYYCLGEPNNWMAHSHPIV